MICKILTVSASSWRSHQESGGSMARIQCLKRKSAFDNFGWSLGLCLLRQGAFDAAAQSNSWLGLILFQDLKKKYGNRPVKRMALDLKINKMMKRAGVI
jgi:hypothetical protein